MRRREFITLLGGAAAWPLAVRAQQPAMPVIGLLSGRPADAAVGDTAAFRQGLKEAGFVEGQNVLIDYRWADGQYDRLPALAAELVRRPVNVIAATGGSAAVLAAKAATKTIPIVFTTGTDPIADGLVASFNRPGGNITGVFILTASLEAKRLELLHEVFPNVGVVATLVNPTYGSAEQQVRDVEAAARAMKFQVVVLKANTASGIDAAFATLVERKIGALLVASDPYFSAQRAQIISLATRHRVPGMFQWRDFAVDGGLMSYGTNLRAAYQLVAGYTGRILKGEKPADLPVQQSTKVELVVNLKTAKALGLTMPPAVLARADEVIE